jgi:hypothetical protein
MGKFARDWLEKFSVGAMLIGLFHGNEYASVATALGLVTVTLAILITRRISK